MRIFLVSLLIFACFVSFSSQDKGLEYCRDGKMEVYETGVPKYMSFWEYFTMSVILKLKYRLRCPYKDPYRFRVDFMEHDTFKWDDKIGTFEKEVVGNYFGVIMGKEFGDFALNDFPSFEPYIVITHTCTSDGSERVFQTGLGGCDTYRYTCDYLMDVDLRRHIYAESGASCGPNCGVNCKPY